MGNPEHIQKISRLRVIQPFEGSHLAEIQERQARAWMHDNPKYTGRVLGFRISSDPYIEATNYESVAVAASSVMASNVKLKEEFLKGYRQGKFIAKQQLRGKSGFRTLIDAMYEDWQRLSRAIKPLPEAEIVR